MAKFDRSDVINAKAAFLNAALHPPTYDGPAHMDCDCRACKDTGYITETREERSYEYAPITREVSGYCDCAKGREKRKSDAASEASAWASERAAQAYADDHMGKPWYFYD